MIWRGDIQLESAVSFTDILYDRLIPEFCAAAGRNCHASSFQDSSVKISDVDARYFCLAWNADLIEHEGRGLYRAPRSAAREQFFWEGPRQVVPRTFTLWLEPVITVAALARLHFDHHWPKHLIGTQSSDWAFDIVAFREGQTVEHVVGEVKKSRREIDELVKLMCIFGASPDDPAPDNGKARNAWKKAAALRARRSPTFWVVGPDGFDQIFSVEHDGECFALTPMSHAALNFPGS